MVEVFKTNVSNPEQANRILRQIHEAFVEYSANFDLEDCDCILRVKSSRGFVQAYSLIQFLRKLGCQAEVLPDEVPFGEVLAPGRQLGYSS
jgi:RNase P protein component